MRKLCFAAAAALAVAGSSLAMAGTIAPDAVRFNEEKVAASLTGVPGDPANGRKVFADRKLGNCLACHKNTDLKNLPFHGEVGPNLDGVALRYKDAELRAILVNSKVVLGEDTIMPAFYRLKTGVRPAKKFDGTTILTAQQVEDVLAYLKTLKKK